MRYGLSIISLVAAAALFFAYGAGPYAPDSLDAGASKKEVRAALGAPTVSRGTINNEYGQVVEVWEYWDSASADASSWYYFVDDQLVQRSAAGDWSDAPERIASTLFNVVEKASGTGA